MNLMVESEGDQSIEPVSTDERISVLSNSAQRYFDIYQVSYKLRNDGRPLSKPSQSQKATL